MGAAGRARSSLLALCLLPALLPLLLLCLPLLCVAVAAARFRRRRRRLLLAAAKRGACCHGSQRRPPGGTEVDGAHRAALLHKYLQDQVELVGAGAAARPAATVAWG
ncbi:uncharacterized protein LOC120643813 [Panicum virgatum]|uniref:uncharacterized protein LOC120643813 n=1 Tax=Panicum virgatum TaxID=38727 RepID=UPI0019D61854|nr:uncharacterized protein LOC120643813 [Panicum virgatum]